MDVQPFDLKALEEKLKAKGLPEVEGLAKAVTESVFEWVKEGIEATPSKIDDLALVVLPPVQKFIMGKIEGIAK